MKKFCLLLLFSLVLNSCQNHYNEFIEWSDNIPKNTPIEMVKKSQPDYVIIDWEKPIKISDEEYEYMVTKIKGTSFQIIEVSNALNFKNNKYQFRNTFH